jgi:hypothetical protein
VPEVAEKLVVNVVAEKVTVFGIVKFPYIVLFVVWAKTVPENPVKFMLLKTF